jgi:hypothetical protein
LSGSSDPQTNSVAPPHATAGTDRRQYPLSSTHIGKTRKRVAQGSNLKMDSFSQQAAVSQIMTLTDIQGIHKGNRAVTMLLQLPFFSGGPAMRSDQWIKLFDNIVAMSNWTDEEIVTMLVTKLTGAANEMLQNILDSVTREYGVIKNCCRTDFMEKKTKIIFSRS